MIKDNIKRAKTYYNISENLKSGFEWIQNNDLKKLADGKYELLNGCYANVQSYMTKDDAPYEIHREYIDIQYMIEGKELSGVTDSSNCTTIKKYDTNNDIEFLNCNTDEKFYELQEGEFFVFFPHDAHKPAIKLNENKYVKKVIVKIKL